MTMDISDFYPNTPMDRYEYLRIPITAIPDCIMEEYKLEPLIHNGFVVVELRKGIYGLPQAGILANIQLKKHLADNDYHPVAHTAGLFKHKTRPVTFSLCVDDFGVKYVGKENAQHLEQVLRQNIESQQTGPVPSTSDLPCNGTTRRARSISPCPATSPRLWSVSSIHTQQGPSALLTTGRHLSMVHTLSSPIRSTHRRLCHLQVCSSSNKSLAPSCIMHEQ
jgi:hypothetical protein